MNFTWHTIIPSLFVALCFLLYWLKWYEMWEDAFCNGSGLMIEVIFSISTFCYIDFSDMECEKPTVSCDENNHVIFYDKSD
jgi:hypothetical protein